MVADAHHVAAGHLGGLDHALDHRADLVRVVARQDAVVALAGEEAVLVLAGDGLEVGVRLGDDAARAAGDDVVGVGVHAAVDHEDDFLAGGLHDAPELLVAREDVLVHPRRRADRAAGGDDVVVADDEVHRQPGEGAEDAAVDLRELVHDPLERGRPGSISRNSSQPKVSSGHMNIVL